MNVIVLVEGRSKDDANVSCAMVISSVQNDGHTPS